MKEFADSNFKFDENGGKFFKQVEIAPFPSVFKTDGNFKFDENGGKILKEVENTVGKGEIAPFPTMFSRDLYCRHVKTRASLGKG